MKERTYIFGEKRKHMRLEYIRSFISVVNCKSFSVAAKQIFLSQPTISTHINSWIGTGGPAAGAFDQGCDSVRCRRYLLSLRNAAS